MYKIVCFLIVFSFTNIPNHFAAGIDKPYFDFFRKLIQPKPKKKRKQVKRRQSIKKSAPTIPPLGIKILGITGEEGSRVAIINYKGDQALVEEGDSKPGIYKVIQIYEDKVVFMHIKASKREISKM
ncbi:MAG: hypothetical protein COB02_05530 [Candidatus Cloacimonadota bacterium]|nr:MAG: hypothetical protein COB02_05530 [Candidatus Cloacimonadota bacterium]